MERDGKTEAEVRGEEGREEGRKGGKGWGRDWRGGGVEKSDGQGGEGEG